MIRALIHKNRFGPGWAGLVMHYHGPMYTVSDLIGPCETWADAMGEGLLKVIVARGIKEIEEHAQG